MTVLLVAYGAVITAGAILALGVVGEMISLLALTNEHDSAGTRQAVLMSVIGLLLLTAAGPAWALNTAWVRLQWIPLRTVWHLFHPSRSADGPETSASKASADTGPARPHAESCRDDEHSA